MNEPSVYDEYLREHGESDFAVVNLGPGALAQIHLVESCLLIPASFAEKLTAGATLTYEHIMVAAWEALEPMSRHGASPAFGAQVLAAVGGNPGRARTSPRRHVRLVLDALDGFRGQALPRHEGRGYVLLGDSLAAMHWEGDAAKAYERGRALLEEASDDLGLRAAYARLASFMKNRGLYEQAVLDAEAGLRVDARLPDGPGNTLDAHFSHSLHDSRADALTRLGFTDEAETALADWRRSGHAPAEGGYRHYYFGILGDLRVRQDRPAEGLDAYLRAIDAQSGSFDSGSLAGRAFYQENSNHLIGGAAGAAVATGHPEIVVAVLAASATGRPASRGEPGEPVRLLEEEAITLARQATSAAVARDFDSLFAYNDRASILLETRDTILRSGAASAERRLTVAELATAIPRSLPPGDVVLHYAQQDDGTQVVFAIHDGVVDQLALELPEDEVRDLADRAYDECIRRSSIENLNRLGTAVLAPVAGLLARASRVFVIAQGSPLGTFPFHAAPFHGQPLLAHVPVRVLPSFAYLRPDRGSRVPEPSRTGLALRALVASVASPRYELLRELPGTRAETDVVRAALPGTTALYDDDATASAVREAMGTADVLHLSGHAVFEPLLPNVARFLLADRPVFAFEVACAARVPRLVNLSGCRAGAERSTLGGEGEGLAAAFLAAGAQTVIAPQWPVRDDAALAFNQALYSELVRPGAEPAQAVRCAQLSLLARPEFAHPGLWGAFTLLESC